MNFAGIRIGHTTDAAFHTGCTVFLCPERTVGGVDVRGPAPGSRETALLAADKPMKYVNAVVLTGGSAFGLATADGVMRYLAEQNIGHPTPIRPIPIVPAAVVYDLFLGGGRKFPGAEMGYAACIAASADSVAQGNFGAGAGVSVGKWGGAQGAMKSGFGLASIELDELVIGAAAVVNAVGDVIAADGAVLAGARSADGSWLADRDAYRRFPALPPASGTNTTLVVLATNASLTRVGCSRLAQRGHDGLAQAIRPAHTTHDGDTVFALATGYLEDVDFDLVANIGVELVGEAIRNAVLHAASVGALYGLAEG